MNSRPVFLVGAIPPPMHGMAAINLAVANALAEEGREVVVCNIGARSLSRTAASRAGRLGRVAAGFLKYAKFCLKHPGNTLYIGLSGGFGQLYESVFVLFARIFQATIVLHHHSFAYIDRWSAATWFLCLVAGRSATHVALSDGMAAGLMQRYKVKKVVVSSNASMISLPFDTEAATSLDVIGYLSNISFEKGIREFLLLARSCDHVKALVAGPTMNAEVSRLVLKAVADGLIAYRGAVDSSQKVDFFDSIDCLVFPTNYANEAEPLVVLEALSQGRPVIANARGCIKDLLSCGAGLAVPLGEDFGLAAQKQIRRWRENPAEFQRAAASAKLRFAELQAASFNFSGTIN